MKLQVVSTLTILLLSGCSFQEPHDLWKYKSTNSFISYQKNFLAGNEHLAKNDLTRAIQHAQSSANLEQLASIYLAKCALDISVGIADKCEEYISLDGLVQSEKMDAYYKLLQLRLGNLNSEKLPKEYQKFALLLKEQKFEKAMQEALGIEKISSRLIAAALIKEHLSHAQKQSILENASEYGYKKSVLFWLQEMKKTASSKENKLIQKRINILNSVE